MAKKKKGSRIRIYQLAKEIGIDTKELIVRLKRDFGIEKNSGLAMIDKEAANIITKKIKKGLKGGKDAEKKEPRKSRPRKVSGEKPAGKSKSREPKPGKQKQEKDKPEKGKEGKRRKRKRKEKPVSSKKEKKEFVPPKIQVKKETVIKKKYKKKKKTDEEDVPASEVIKVPQNCSVGDLADILNISAAELIKKLMSLGIFANITQKLDDDTILTVSDEFDKDVVIEEVFIGPDLAVSEEEISSGLPRSPIVTVMGHVDHGKTTLLDVLRNTDVAEHEDGRITQKIGASVLKTPNGKIIFVDTPGHEAFTTMRARGAQVTDIVVLVVAADDGVMPQTVEAINHAKAAGIPIIVAINKVDLPNANLDKVKQGLIQHGLTPDSWGGNTTCVEISALKKLNLEELITAIQLEAEHLELKAPATGPGKGIVIESRKDKQLGNICTLIVMSGILKVGDSFVCGLTYGRVRAMISDKGERLKKAPPSTPVEIVGFNALPEPGDVLAVVEGDKEARSYAEERQSKLDNVPSGPDTDQPITLESLFSNVSDEDVKVLNIILKCDSIGGLEAVIGSVRNIETDKVKLNIIHQGIGNLTDNDVKLAIASENTVIIVFNAGLMPGVRDLAKQHGIQIKRYQIIYELINELKLAMEGLLSPIEKEEVLGHAEVRQLFKISRTGTIAGCYVKDGVIKKSGFIRVIRDGDEIYDGNIESLKHIKDDVSEVKNGFECGIKIKGFNEIELGDILEAYHIVKEKQKLN